ncbi:hypothetical protein [Streptomyces sp. NPDC003077]|uniref:hypothetical protein n=1 Tax=Streptomyces sp. NPDC003077 TaxID=3154443 RepID=UPI0033B07947
MLVVLGVVAVLGVLVGAVTGVATSRGFAVKVPARRPHLRAETVTLSPSGD